jgi:hypothetical protein
VRGQAESGTIHLRPIRLAGPDRKVAALLFLFVTKPRALHFQLAVGVIGPGDCVAGFHWALRDRDAESRQT